MTAFEESELREHDNEAQEAAFKVAGVRDLPAHVSPTIRGLRESEAKIEEES